MDINVFKNGIKELNLNGSDEIIEKFRIFSSVLLEWNEKMNLTAVTDPVEISVKHFLDSIAPLSIINIKKNSKIIDVGTGAGFPGIPLKIMREDLNFTFMDSLNKRINFLKEVSNKINLSNVEFIHSRAEESGKNEDFREKYDYAVSRAVANLKVLCEYCIPFVKVGGYFISFKQFEVEEEIKEAKDMIKNLGGMIKEIKEIKIPESDIKRRIIIIEKTKETPKQYPRHPNKIKK